MSMLQILPVLGALLAVMPADAADPTGRWLTAGHDAVIEIMPCGSALCGRIVGVTLDHPDDPPPRDAHGNPQCGEVIITDMRPEGTNFWRGMIRDPRNDRSFHAEMWLGQHHQLELRGYLGVPVFGATQDWSRFDKPIGGDCLMERG